ncbi:hypothetical protein ColKHC_00307 [Colletotrichum higginsianum]|nr:hypothetical protein ColKHC_00307 [Colletotrichum higginsianum]
MLRLKNIGWEGSSMTWKNEEALKTATADTYRFAVETKRFLPKPTQAAQDFDDVNPLEEIFRKNLDRISECITAVRPRVYALDLGGAANAFLQLAVDIETMLLELLEQQEEDLIIEGLLQALTSKIDKMSLAQVIEAVPQSQEVSSP